jgi:hypothetical protein
MAETIITRVHYHRTLGKKDTTVVAKFTGSEGTFIVTVADYLRLLEEQNSRCAICKTEHPSGYDRRYTIQLPGDRGGLRRRFAIDHDHETGQVRGLLCSKCNSGIGYLKDSRQLLLKAAIYLDDHAKENGKESIFD